jgi:hypothetical protein
MSGRGSEQWNTKSDWLDNVTKILKAGKGFETVDLVMLRVCIRLYRHRRAGYDCIVDTKVVPGGSPVRCDRISEFLDTTGKHQSPT